MRLTLMLRKVFITPVVAVLAFAGLATFAPNRAFAASSLSVTAEVPTLAGGNVEGTAVDYATDMIYVSDSYDNVVTVINGATNQVADTISIGSPFTGNQGYFFVNNIAVNQATNTIYVSNMASNVIAVINGTTNQVVTNIPVGHEPEGIGVNEVTNTIYVANYIDSTISVIDGASQTVTGTISAYGFGLPTAVAVNDVTNQIYVASDAGNILDIDGSGTNSPNVIRTDSSLGIVVDPATNNVYIASAMGSLNRFEIYNATTNTLSFRNIPTPISISETEGMAFNPTTDTIYLGEENSPITVFDVANNSVSEGLAYSPNDPVGIGVDALTGAVYVSDVQTGQEVVIGAQTPIAAPIITSTATANESASITWTPPAGTILGYIVQVTNPDNTTHSITYGPSATSATVTGLNNGTAYALSVVAIGPSGPGQSTVNDPVTPYPLAPGAPTISLHSETSSTLSITWAAAQQGDEPIEHYKVSVTPSGGQETDYLLSSSATSYTVTGLNANTSYSVSVTAMANDSASQASNVITASTSAAAHVQLPGSPTISSHSATASSISVSWSPGTAGDEATQYYIVTAVAGATTDSQIVAAGVQSYTLQSLSANTSYVVVVTPVAADGIGQPSASLTMSTAQASPSVIHAPTAPLRVSAKAIGSKMTVSWRAPISNGGASIAYYTVTLSPGGKRCVTSALSCAIPGLSKSKHYSVSITASNRAGTGPAAMVRNVKG
jgi:YVTN family beta-propeller protein